MGGDHVDAATLNAAMKEHAGHRTARDAHEAQLRLS